MRTIINSACVFASTALFAAVSSAAPFTPGTLVVMRVGTANSGGSEAFRLVEYNFDGTPTGNVIALPSTGPAALVQANVSGHDRHIHRSTDRRFLTLVAVASPAGPDDPLAFSAAQRPRVVVRLAYDGTIDTTTRLTDAYNFTAVRGAITSDGTKIWVAGDNASGATNSGGLRYTTLGSSTTVNLSQVQVNGGPQTPDNVRDVNIFSGQLYNCSGSNSSIGKGTFRVGSGLPTSGSQTLVGPFNGSDGASTSSFALLDLDPAVPGVDTLYAATSAAGQGIHKYVLNTAGVWQPRGIFSTLPVDAEHVIARAQPDGSVRVVVGTEFDVMTFQDTQALTSVLGNVAFTTITSASASEAMGGFDFAPVAPCEGDINGDFAVNTADLTTFLGQFGSAVTPGTGGDLNGDGAVNTQDLTRFLARFGTTCPF